MATRRERVILELEDNFTTGMARAAAETALLNRELKNLNGTPIKTAARDLDNVGKSADQASKDVEKVGKSSDQSGKEVDRLSGRLRLFTDAALTIGPALIPIGAVAVPAIVGLAAGFGAAAGAAGVAVLAFKGVGDALKSLDAYNLEPTQANLEKMQAAMDKVGPAGADFVRFLDSIEPQLSALQNTAREGMFPGVERGIEDVLTLLPQVQKIIANVSVEMGNLAKEAGLGLSGDGFAAFFDYLQADAAPTLAAFAHTIGNVAEGFANLFVAFAPLTRDFSSGMESMSRSFADWAAGLSQTRGFQDFVDYIRESGPQVIEFLGAMSSAFVGIIKAAAPVGQAVLPVLTSLAKVLGALADSSIGKPLFTAAAALITFNRAASLFKDGGALAKIPGLAQSAGSGLSTLASDFSLLGTTAMTAGAKSEREIARIAESTKRANMAMSSVGKGITFAAVISGIGLVNAAFNQLETRVDGADLNRNLDAFARGDSVENLNNLGEAVRNFNSAGDRFNDVAGAILTFNMDDSTWEKAKSDIDQVDQALAQMVESGNAREAEAAFARIADQAKAQGVSMDDVNNSFDAYNTALKNAQPSIDAAAKAQARSASAAAFATINTDRYRGAVGGAGIAAGITATKVRGLVSAMKEERSAALGAFDAETQWRQALKDAQAQAAKNNAGLKGNSDAALQNRAMISQLAAAWNNQSDAVRNNVSRFKQAKASFIQTAESMGVPRKAAIELANSLLDIPTKRVIDVAMTGDQKSLSTIASIRYALDQLHDKTVTINTVHQESYLNKRANDPAPGQAGGAADGTTVPKDARPYADRYLYMLAPGEEVISNRYGQADQFRADRASGRIPGYADGGTIVQPQRMPSSRSSSTVVVSPQSLVGLRIEGRMDVATGNIRGIVREEIGAERRFDRDHRRG